jgi:glycerol uptake facilitator-like aquaporin
LGSEVQRVLIAIGGVAFAVSALLPLISQRTLETPPDEPTLFGHVPAAVSQTGAIVFAAIIGTSLLLALLLSKQSNLIQARCLSILTPICLVGLGAAADRQWRTARYFSTRIGLLVAAVAIVGAYSSGTIRILTSHKSNARDLARAVAGRSRPTDLVIVAPEWLASSFNHYFVPANDQIDYPHTGREEAVDFSDLMLRLRDSTALIRTVKRLSEARHQSRRIWLISERQYFLARRSSEPVDVMNPPDSLLVHIRIQQIRNTIISLYGKPDTSLARGKSRDRYEHLVAYLFAAPPDSVSKHDKK